MEGSELSRLGHGRSSYGLYQLIGTVFVLAVFSFARPGTYPNKGPSLYERFRSGAANDVDILISLGMIIAIAYSVAVLISDVRSTGRWW